MGKVQRIGEEIVKDILGEVGKDLKNNKQSVSQRIKGDLNNKLDEIKNKISYEEGDLLQNLPPKSNEYLNSMIIQFKNMTNNKQLLKNFCNTYIKQQNMLLSNLQNQQNKEEQEKIQEHINKMTTIQDMTEKLFWEEKNTDSKNVTHMINLMKSHGRVLTSILTEDKTKKFQKELNEIKKQSLVYHEDLNLAMGQTVKTQLVLNSPDKKTVRLITFNSSAEILDFLQPDYSSTGELTYRYQVGKLLSADMESLGEDIVEFKQEGENVKITGVNNVNVNKHLINLFTQYIDAKVSQRKDGIHKLINRLKEIAKMKRFYRTTELEEFKLETSDNLLTWLINNNAIEKVNNGNGYLIQNSATIESIMKKLETEVASQAKKEATQAVQQGTIHAQNFGVLNEAFFAAYLNAVQSSSKVELQTFLKDVTNLSGLLQGDVSQGRIEYAIKADGASMMSIPQLIQTAEIIDKNFKTGDFLKLRLFLQELKAALHKGNAHINGNPDEEMKNGVEQVGQVIKST